MFGKKKITGWNNSLKPIYEQGAKDFFKEASKIGEEDEALNDAIDVALGRKKVNRNWDYFKGVHNLKK